MDSPHGATRGASPAQAEEGLDDDAADPVGAAIECADERLLVGLPWEPTVGYTAGFDEGHRLPFLGKKCPISGVRHASSVAQVILVRHNK